ncbi:MAG: universal stress protein [Alphaproteobacteria bacterium]|nr:universal stress protein [Alphaproteobacteria bacterium]
MRQRVLVVTDVCWTDRFAGEAALALIQHARSLGYDMFVTAFAGFDEEVVRESKARKIRGHTVHYDADLPNVIDTLRANYGALVDAFANKCRGQGIECATEVVSVEPLASLLRSVEVSDWAAVPRDSEFSHSEGLTQAVPKSGERVALQLCREAAIPVLMGPAVAQQEPPSPPRKVLVAYDGSDGASRIVHSIGGLGLADGYEAEVLTIASNERDARALAERATAVLATHGAHAVAVPVASTADPADILLDRVAATRPAYLAMGAFGRRTWKERIFGSVTEKLLADCPCALLIQR